MGYQGRRSPHHLLREPDSSSTSLTLVTAPTSFSTAPTPSIPGVRTEITEVAVHEEQQPCDIRIAVSGDGARILTHAYEVNTVVCWNTSDMEKVQQYPCDQVICSALSEDGNKAIVVSRPRHPSYFYTISLWDITEHTVKLRSLDGNDGRLDVWDISWPAKMVAAAAREDGILFVWDMESGNLRYMTEFNHGARSCCRFSPCGQFILVGRCAQ
ncbi:hypothetical protein Vretifemale_19444 [Volvox reticuliferus]|uniref:Uncharacterized protein n=1 Tax=Volvox reticuliferus TaxID=1737510 RepID=A0A8J4CXQ0_9CHLO|nr:hypothetical protein Vretifemale_19444 [Volvox reticuliferus]